MSYEIIYDRRFISIGEKFIPLFQSGSSNCTEYNDKGNEVSEKNWSIFNYGFRNKILFTESEIIELAENYKDAEFFKTRTTPFKKGEFERWFVNGTKHAQPIEYYLEFGNHMCVVEYGPNRESTRRYIRSTEELMIHIDKNEAKNLFGNAYVLNLQFSERDLRLPRKRRGSAKRIEYPEFYILTSSDGYFVRKTKRGYKYSYYRSSGQIKKFKTENEAVKYLDKYPGLKEDFTIEKVEETVML